jgi:hypothetical protein
MAGEDIQGNVRLRAERAVRVCAGLERALFEFRNQYYLRSDYADLKPLLDKCRSLITSLTDDLVYLTASNPEGMKNIVSRHVDDLWAAFADVVPASKGTDRDTRPIDKFEVALRDVRGDVNIVAVMAGVETDLPPVEDDESAAGPHRDEHAAETPGQDFVEHGPDQSGKAQVEALVSRDAGSGGQVWRAIIGVGLPILASFLLYLCLKPACDSSRERTQTQGDLAPEVAATLRRIGRLRTLDTIGNPYATHALWTSRHQLTDTAWDGPIFRHDAYDEFAKRPHALAKPTAETLGLFYEQLDVIESRKPDKIRWLATVIADSGLPIADLLYQAQYGETMVLASRLGVASMRLLGQPLPDSEGVSGPRPFGF